MMKTIKDLKLLLLLVLYLGATSACTNDVPEAADPSPFTLEKEGYSLLKDMTLSLEAQTDRSESYSQPFEIEDVEREGDLIHIRVVFPSGCSENRFEIIWDGKIMETHPVQTRLFVKRTASGCSPSQAEEHLLLTVDVKELAEKSGSDQLIDAVFIISNASKKPQMTDADIPVSSYS